MIQSQELTIKVKPVEGETPTFPSYKTDGAGAFDFYANQDAVLNYGSPAVIGTGLQFEIPKGYAMFIYSRSGHGFNDNVRLGNCVGVIDSDYRGEVFIKLTMDFPSWQTTLEIKKGHRIAQGIVQPVPKVSFISADSLSETERGSGGFGSTGVN